MMDKRLGKVSELRVTNAIKANAPNANPDLLIIAMGSTGGTIEEARSRLTADGITTNHIMVRQMHPFPSELLKPHLDAAKQVVILENNATGQLANLIKQNNGYHDKIRNLLKYDGTPFLPSEIHKACKELN